MNATDTTGTTTVAETRFGLRSLLALHLFVVWQVWMMLGAGPALLQAFVPPWLPTRVAGMIVRAPTFAMLCLVAAAMALVVAYLSLRHAFRPGGRWPRILTATLAVVWTPVLCGELLRMALMEPALASAQAQCTNSSLLIESMRSHLTDDPPQRPHAWIVHGRDVRLWSYRTLRFEPAPGWSDAAMAVERCAMTHARGASR